jgi:hypothetical protein
MVIRCLSLALSFMFLFATIDADAQTRGVGGGISKPRAGKQLTRKKPMWWNVSPKQIVGKWRKVAPEYVQASRHTTPSSAPSRRRKPEVWKFHRNGHLSIDGKRTMVWGLFAYSRLEFGTEQSYEHKPIKATAHVFGRRMILTVERGRGLVQHWYFQRAR